MIAISVAIDYLSMTKSSLHVIKKHCQIWYVKGRGAKHHGTVI